MASVKRADLEQGLRELMFSSNGDYSVVVGGSGAGKSTAVRRVIGSLDTPKGIAYFSAPELTMDFSTRLATTLGYFAPLNVSGRLGRLLTAETKEEQSAPSLLHEPRATWSALCPFLERAARRYHQAHAGHVPVLVLDGMDIVARAYGLLLVSVLLMLVVIAPVLFAGKDPVFFSEIQDFAKSCADRNVLRIVFVFSDGALPLLLGSSAVSRADSPFEVGEISDTDATTYLLSLGADPARARELVSTLAGGNFPLLHKYGKSKLPLATVRRMLYSESAISLLRLGVSAHHPLFAHLTQNAVIQTDNVCSMIPEALFEGLLKRNILAVHSNGTCTFQNRHVAAFLTAERDALAAKSWSAFTSRYLQAVGKVFLTSSVSEVRGQSVHGNDAPGEGTKLPSDSPRC